MNIYIKHISLHVFIFGYIFWYGLGFLHPEVNMNQISYYSLFLIFAFPLIVLIGYNIPTNKPSYNDNVINFESNTGLVLLTLFLGISFLLFLVSSGMPRYHLIRILVTFAIFFICIFLLSNIKSKQNYSLLIVLFLIGFLFIDLYTRRPIFSVIFPVIYFFLLKQIEQNVSFGKLFKLITIFSLMLLLFFLFTAYRSSNDGEVNLSSLFQLASDIILLGSGFDTIYLTDYVVSSYNINNFLLGDSFLAGLLNIIPREFWTDKPLAFGITLSSKYFGIDTSEIFTNFGPGLVAEAYANGGISFVIFISLLLGYTLRVFDNWNSQNVFDFFKFGITSIFLPGLFFLIRGDFVNAFYEIYFKILFFILMTYLFKKFILR